MVVQPLLPEGRAAPLLTSLERHRHQGTAGACRQVSWSIALAGPKRAPRRTSRLLRAFCRHPGRLPWDLSAGRDSSKARYRARRCVLRRRVDQRLLAIKLAMTAAVISFASV